MEPFLAGYNVYTALWVILKKFLQNALRNAKGISVQYIYTSKDLIHAAIPPPY
jgi:hypothetical protein